LCDNISSINLTKNPVQHFRKNHIEIRNYFIKDHTTHGDCEEFFEIMNQLAHLFTKNLARQI